MLDTSNPLDVTDTPRPLDLYHIPIPSTLPGHTTALGWPMPIADGNITT